MIPSLFKSSSEKWNLIETALSIYKIINSYNTDLRTIARCTVIENFENIYELGGGELLDKFGNEVVDTLTSENIEKYLAIIEKIILIFDKNKDFKRSIKWNNLKLSHYEGDIDAIIRAIFYLCNVNNKVDFFEYNKKIKIASVIIKFVNDNIDKISKVNIPILFSLIEETERNCF